MTDNELWQEVYNAFESAFAHARTCTKCYVPIVDDEGNPKYRSEACPEGALILTLLIEAEHRYFERRR